MTLRELHENATPAPWVVGAWFRDWSGKSGKDADGKPNRCLSTNAAYGIVCADRAYDVLMTDDGYTTDIDSDAALIVALRNAYADGTLVERSELDEALEAVSAAQDYISDLLRLPSPDFIETVRARRADDALMREGYSDPEREAAAREAVHSDD